VLLVLDLWGYVRREKLLDPVQQRRKSLTTEQPGEEVCAALPLRPRRQRLVIDDRGGDLFGQPPGEALVADGGSRPGEADLAQARAVRVAADEVDKLGVD